MVFEMNELKADSIKLERELLEWSIDREKNRNYRDRNENYESKELWKTEKKLV